MSDKVLIKKETMIGLADAIREKTGKSESYKPSEMAGAVASIESGLSIEEAEYLLGYNFKSSNPEETWPSKYHFKYNKSLGIEMACKNIPQEFDYTFDIQELHYGDGQCFKDFGKYLTCTAVSTEKRIAKFPYLTKITGNGSSFYNTKFTHIYFDKSIFYSEYYTFGQNKYLRYLDLRSLDKFRFYAGTFSKCGDTEKGVTIYCENCASIDGRTFSECILNELVLNTDSLVTLSGTGAFQDTWIANETEKGFIFVKDELVNTYKEATNWSVYANKIKPISEWGGVPE